jgi:hypothetical protein
MHQRLPHSGTRPQGVQHGRSLHEVWASADYVQNVHKLWLRAYNSSRK